MVQVQHQSRQSARPHFCLSSVSDSNHDESVPGVYGTDAILSEPSTDALHLDPQRLRRVLSFRRTMDAPLPAQDEALVAGFPLSNLPTEVILHIVRCLDERPSSSSFPPGPSVDLLALSACSTFFYATCRPLVWRSISFEADLGGMRPESWIERRSLKTLRDLMRESKVVIGARAGNDNELTTKTQLEDQRAFAPLPIKAFSYSYPRLPFHLSDDDLRPELEALLDVIILLRHSPTQVIFLKGAEVASKRLSAAILGALMQIETLSALRLNQMEFTGPLSFLPTAPALPHLRTLQIMHGAPKLVELVRLAPNLESLLMWPSARSYRDLGPDILQKLPHLRLLSLDAVHEPTLFGALTRKIEVIGRAATVSLLTTLTFRL